jgi:hypothetical protein
MGGIPRIIPGFGESQTVENRDLSVTATIDQGLLMMQGPESMVPLGVEIPLHCQEPKTSFLIVRQFATVPMLQPQAMLAAQISQPGEHWVETPFSVQLHMSNSPELSLFGHET